MIIEAMKQALEALDAGPNAYFLMNTGGIANKLRQAIAEAEKQEPVAWMDRHFTCDLYKNKPELDVLPLYTHPQPKREWVGLTLDEIDLLEELYAPPVHPDFVNDASHCLELIRHVEAKLKEKNT
jgi:hypothetical protein